MWQINNETINEKTVLLRYFNFIIIQHFFPFYNILSSVFNASLHSYSRWLKKCWKFFSCNAFNTPINFFLQHLLIQNGLINFKKKSQRRTERDPVNMGRIVTPAFDSWPKINLPSSITINMAFSFKADVVRLQHYFDLQKIVCITRKHGIMTKQLLSRYQSLAKTLRCSFSMNRHIMPLFASRVLLLVWWTRSLITKSCTQVLIRK